MTTAASLIMMAIFFLTQMVTIFSAKLILMVLITAHQGFVVGKELLNGTLTLSIIYSNLVFQFSLS